MALMAIPVKTPPVPSQKARLWTSTRKATKTIIARVTPMIKRPNPSKAELAGSEITDETIDEVPKTAWDNAGCQNMQQGWAGQGKVVIEPPLDDDIAQVEGVAEEQTCQSEGAGGDAKDDEHIGQLPATNGWKTVEEDDPDDEVDRVVQDHTDGLRDESSAVFHRCGEVGLPEGREGI